MTKPSQRRPVRYDQSGCMWGLISILDFRHGSRSTRRLLADKRRAMRQTFDEGDSGDKPKLLTDVEENLQSNLGGEESTVLAGADVPANKPSVKTLIEEEMVSEQHTGTKPSDSKLHNEQHEDRKKKKNRKRSKRNSRGSLDMDVGDLNDGHESLNSSRCPCNHTPDEGLANKQNGNDIVLEEFCNHINQRGISEVSLELKRKDSDLDVKEKLREAIKEFISREVAKEKNLVENGRINFSKEVVDALQIPNLNEESFLKLLQDPTSFPMKSTEALDSCKDDKLNDSEELVNNNHNSKHRKLFRRQVKSPETKPQKKGHKGPDSDTIVILKPGPSTLKSCETEGGPDSISDSSRRQQAERARSYLFLEEIKRRWKNVMGKEQNSDTVVKRPSFRYGGENPGKKSPSKDHFYIEKIAKPRDLKVSTESGTVGSSKQRVPDIYIEARRHLSEMLNYGHEEANSSSGAKSPKTLARILALSEFNSPVPSPGRNWERSFVMAQRRFSGHNNNQSEKFDENAEQQMEENNGSCLKDSMQNAETEPSNVETRDVEDDLSAARKDMASDANAGDMITSNEITQEECRGIAPTYECIERASGTSKQDEETENPETESLRGNQLPSSSFESPPSSSITKTVNASEILGDKPERPSPVSVLEPLFTEEDLSPARTAVRSVKLPIEQLEIKFEDGDNFTPKKRGNVSKSRTEAEEEEETLILYIRSVLRACGLNWNELYLKSQSSDELLEPSSYGEADFFCNCPQYDQNLVFDCINEVLLEVCDDYFRFCPRVSFVKPIIRPIPDLKDAIHEVWERVRWHLLLMPQPQTLDQIVRRDMAKGDKWMDLRPDTESIGFETGDEILDDLIEDYVGESLESLYASSFAEVIESGDNTGL
ncbi:uncharacterized protein LOC116209370 [Punica granatum]|uniref:Uncharacterized protein LOC116209370 n=1 Tax=Punica granatum TaxID=22663 RepID=A0A6P8DSG0_PUNGR|nr:uncharacterized protein LOC116209370 [Punica granatum]